MKIVLSTATWYTGDEQLVGAFEAEVRATAVGHDLVCVPPDGDLLGAIADAEVFFPLSGRSLTPDVIDAAANLKWLHLASAGVEHALYPPLLQRDVLVTNGAGVYAIPIAEHVLALMLALSRRVPEMIRQQDKPEWTGLSGGELHGATVLIVGVGGIGAKVAQLCKAFGMRVVGIRRHTGMPVACVDSLLAPTDLKAVLPEADWVVLCAPSTPQTQHMIGAAEISLLKPEARIINIARGALIDEAALIQALQEGRISGAGLDVFAEEPLPPDSPLWDMPQVIVSPHSGGASPNSLAPDAGPFQGQPAALSRRTAIAEYR